MADVENLVGEGLLQAGLTKILTATDNSTLRAEPARDIWLEAWNDPVAGLSAFTSCVHTCNLFGDGDWRLVVADSDKKLKVWKNTAKASEHALLEAPVAIVSFVSENTQPRLPSMAVAAAGHVYIYRNLRPYYKFVLPPEPVNEEEQQIWDKVTKREMVIGDAVSALTLLQDRGVLLTIRSLQVMNIADPDRKSSFLEQCRDEPLVAHTVVTCLDVINLAVDEGDAVSCVIIGTESGRVLILNPLGTAVLHNVFVGATPAFMAVQGELEVGYRITVAGRDGKLYTIRNAKVEQTIIQLESPPVGLVKLGKNILVGCMNDVMHSYQHTGHKNYSIYLPANIHTMTLVAVQAQRMTKAVAVALANLEVRIYNEKHLVSLFTVKSPVTALFFGRYGREDNTLITITKAGALDIKILPRHANLEVSSSAVGPPPEQDIPLQVPKKTRLYVEQTQREREQAVEMHRIFQRDLCKLRLTTARAYVKILTDGRGAATFTSSANLSLNASVQGLGPRFKVNLAVRNEGGKPVTNLVVLLSCNEAMYQANKKQFTIPLLVPSLAYSFDIDVLCLEPAAGTDSIRILLLQSKSSMPILSALLKMPISELDE